MEGFAKGGYVLILEDDVNLVLILEIILEQDNVTAIICQTNESAILTMQIHGSPMLAVVDYTIKPRTCALTTDFLSKVYPHVPIVLMTAWDDVASLILQCRSSDIIKKPFTLEHFLSTIHKHYNPPIIRDNSEVRPTYQSTSV